MQRTTPEVWKHRFHDSTRWIIDEVKIRGPAPASAPRRFRVASACCKNVRNLGDTGRVDGVISNSLNPESPNQWCPSF